MKPDFRSRNELAVEALHRLGSQAFGEAVEEAFRLQQRRAHNAVEIEAVAAFQRMSLMRIREAQFLEKSRDSDPAEKAEKKGIFSGLCRRSFVESVHVTDARIPVLLAGGASL